MTNENEFTCKQVLFADILGFSELTLKHGEKAKSDLKKFRGIIADCSKGYDTTKIFSRVFSDHIIAGFKDFNDAISFSKTLFNKTFYEEIGLRGTIGIGEFTIQVNSDNGSSLEIGPGLVLATFAEKYHVKGHILLMVYENNMRNVYPGYEPKPFIIKRLPKKFKAYIVPWWERSESKKMRNEIDKRTRGLTCETIRYLEKTKENMNYFKERDTTSEPKPIANTVTL